MNKLYDKRLFEKFFKLINDCEKTDKICKEIVGLYKKYYRNGVRDFYIDYIENHTDYTNVMNEFVEYHKYGKRLTKQKFIIRYGETLGCEKWNNYVKKQSFSNTFEYKNKKYGWSKEIFDQYNKNRAITKDNLIRKHGEEKGTIIWNRYVERQRYAGCSLEYFIEKLGEKDGTDFFKKLNSKKSININNFIEKYGLVEGQDKFNILMQKYSKLSRVSKNSQLFFDELLSKIPLERHDDIFYYSKNYEYFFAKKEMGGIYFCDFYDISQNKIIEFFGDYYHCNPIKFGKDYFNIKNNMSAQEIWHRDEKRIKDLETFFGATVLIVWENDVRNDIDKTIKNCLNFLNYEN